MKQGFLTLLKADPSDKVAVFETVASRLGTTARNIEKDFYVCLLLHILFNDRPSDGVRLYFKGGTSLSKGYGLIKRFSEDIDIGVYKEDLNLPLEADIEAQVSHNQRQKMLQRIDGEAAAYFAGPLRDLISRELSKIEQTAELGGHFKIEFGADRHGKEALDVLLVQYKSAFSIDDEYVKPSVMIEGGARPDPDPVSATVIKPYISDDLPDLDFQVPGVTTVSPERTFWEKALILHAMTETTERRTARGENGGTIPDLNRYSRHYYDVHQFWIDTSHGRKTAANLKIAEACRKHKEMMYRAPDHGYENAVPGKYRLVPTLEMVQKLRSDYEKMAAMIFGEAPKFEDVLNSIEQLQTFVNVDLVPSMRPAADDGPSP